MIRFVLLLCAVFVIYWVLNRGSSGYEAIFPEDSRKILQTEPIQTPPARSEISWKNGDYTINALAEFHVVGRVLSTSRYRTGRESELSPIDIALGWKDMAKDVVINALDISQYARFYTYRWSDAPPIDPNQIIVQSANMHLIPANNEIEKQLLAARREDIVELKGALVRISGKDGWGWGSSMTRSDTGAGACELIWVESVKRYKKI